MQIDPTSAFAAQVAGPCSPRQIFFLSLLDQVGPMTRFASILETVGNTPAVKIRRLAPPGIDLYVKIEAFNPLGSVKDRLALGVIEDAEKRGALKPGQTVIEATS